MEGWESLENLYEDEHGTYTCALCNAKSILEKYKEDEE